MERTNLEQLLARAERDLERGERIIARQHTYIEKQLLNGHDCTQSRKLLALFCDVQRMHLAHLNQLQDEVEALPRAH